MIRVTNDDLECVNQRIIEPRIKIDVYDDNNKLLDSIQGGIIGGTSSINSESDIRRTFNIDVIPRKQLRVEISEDGLIWLNRTVKLQLGIYNRRTKKYNWYTVECIKDGKLRTIEDIHEEIYNEIKKHI